MNSRPIGATLIVALALGSTGALFGADAGLSDAARASSAVQSLNGTDSADLHPVHLDETLLFEEGTATGSLPGRMRAELDIGQTFRGRFTIDTGHGSITGRGSAVPHGAGRYQSFAGSLTVTGGSGRYAHIRGRTELDGVFDRRTYAVTVHTHGRLSY